MSPIDKPRRERVGPQRVDPLRRTLPQGIQEREGQTLVAKLPTIK